MKSIHIRAIGSPSEAWQKDAAETYLTRLKPYAKIEIQELPEGHKSSAKPDAARAKAEEASSLLKAHKLDTFMIALDETGKEYDSPSFSKQLEKWVEGGKPLTFLIGGSWGLDETVRKHAHALLSLGKMTLPHGLARVVLLEQLYRAEAISRGKEYHK